MKKLIFAAAFLFGIFTLKQADAQISISLNLNIDSQPDWGPTGYDHVDYYYLPDIDCYYYVPGKQFVYQSGSQWVWRSTLPPQYSNYDLYNGYKVVVNKPRPYMQNTVYRSKYSSYKGRRNQPVIRDSHDTKYQHNRPAPGRPVPAPEHRPATRPAPPRKPAPHQAPQHKPTNNHHDDKHDEKGHGHH